MPAVPRRTTEPLAAPVRRAHPAGPSHVGSDGGLWSAVPSLVPVLVAALGLVGVLLVLAGSYSPIVTLIVGLVLGGGLALLVGRHLRPVCRGAWWWDPVAVVAALLWSVVNAALSGQGVLVARDPNVYAVTAEHLTTSATVDTATQAQVFGVLTDFSFKSAGFDPVRDGSALVAQGMHVLPTLLAVPGGLLGDAWLLRGNAFVGGAALLSVYALARLVVGRGWGLAAAALLGLTLPQISFSREVYTEPLTQLLVFGGLALLWQVRPAGRAPHAVAGLVLGCSVLVRVDAYLVLPPLLLALLLDVAGAASQDRGRFHPSVILGAFRGPRSPMVVKRWRNGLAVLAGAAVPAVVGVLDLTLHSPVYAGMLRGQLLTIGALAVLLALVGLAAIALSVRAPLPLRGAGVAAAGLVLVAGVFFATRPLWTTVRDSDDNPTVVLLQQLHGLAADPRRTYAEHSATWLGWYLGVPVAVLGVLGLAALAGRAGKGRLPAAVPFLLVLALTALLYLYSPSNTPDQLWVARRYLPLVMPGLAVGAVTVVSLVLTLVAAAGLRRVLAGVTLLVLAVPPALTTAPLFFVRQGVPQLTEVQALCAALPPDAAVVVAGDLSFTYPQTVRAYCGVPVVAYRPDGPPTSASGPADVAPLVAAAAEQGRRLWLVTGDEPAAAAFTARTPAPLSTITYRQWEARLERAPRRADTLSRSLYAGPLQTDGRVGDWSPG